MPSITFTKEDFSNFIVLYLLDQSLNKDDIKDEKFKEFIEKILPKIKPDLVRFFMKSDVYQRTNFNRMKQVFKPKNPIGTFIILPEKD